MDTNITLQGRSSNTASLVVLTSSDAKLVMNTGSKIVNNTVTRNDSATGGGVDVGNGEFIMNGGTISGNKVEATTSSSGYSSSTVAAKGGGVRIDSGTFTMNDGTISGNTAYSEKFPAGGGGVSVDNGTFIFKGGTISDNTVDSRAQGSNPYAYGGGVAVWNSGTFTMQGGTISGNQAVSSAYVLTSTYYYGGGVYVTNDKFTKTGGTIYGSNASPDTLRNLAKDRTSSTIDTTSGHAAFVKINSTTIKRNNTAGAAVNLDSSKTGSSGGWE
ncbi:MAG: hypothetical protein LBD48_14370 [Treponema sp.]|nr:hypothetical protein [Treponema sp.]